MKTTIITTVSIAIIICSCSYAELVNKTVERINSQMLRREHTMMFHGKTRKTQYDIKKKKQAMHADSHLAQRDAFSLFPPGNDNFANRVTIISTNGTTVGSNIDATMELYEPMILSYANGSNSVWWTWTCPETGWYGFDTIGSGFDTVLGIFIGNSVAQLGKLVYNDDITYYGGGYSLQSYVSLYANAGQTYQIGVAGYNQYSEGNITLNWYPDSFTPYDSVVITSSWHEVLLANNGSALDANNTTLYIQSLETNHKGIKVIHYSTKSAYAGVNVTDKKKNKLVKDATFSGIQGEQQWISDFDGNRILVTSWSPAVMYARTLHLYKVTRKGLKKMGAYTVSNNFYWARLDKKWIYVHLFDWSTWINTGFLALNKNMEKIAWEVPMTQGWLSYLFENGVAVIDNWGINNLQIQVTKKGKPYGTHTLTYPDSGNLIYRADSKGGILYWNYYNGTNLPMTYMDRKGKKKVEDFSPDSFSMFHSAMFNGRVLNLTKWIPGGANIQTYKWGKKPKKNGETTIPGLFMTTMDGAKLYFSTKTNNTFAVKEFDKKLTKTKWENSGPGYVGWYLGKGVFYRLSTNGTTTTYTIFRKEKDIAEHTFTD